MRISRYFPEFLLCARRKELERTQRPGPISLTGHRERVIGSPPWTPALKSTLAEVGDAP